MLATGATSGLYVITGAMPPACAASYCIKARQLRQSWQTGVAATRASAATHAHLRADGGGAGRVQQHQQVRSQRAQRRVLKNRRERQVQPQVLLNLQSLAWDESK